MAYMLGPMLAGLVSGLFGATMALSINAASASGLALIRFRPRVEPEEPMVAARWFDLRKGFLAGAGFLWRTPVLRALSSLLMVFVFLSLGMTDVFIYHVRHDLGQDDRVVGYVIGMAGVGAIAGATPMAPLRRWWGFGPSWLGSVGLCGIAVTVAGAANNVALVGTMVLAYSLSVVLAALCSRTLRRKVTPDHMLGRVTSAFWTIHHALAPIGAIVLTASANGIGGTEHTARCRGGVPRHRRVGLSTPVPLRRPERRFAAPNPSSLTTTGTALTSPSATPPSGARASKRSRAMYGDEQRGAGVKQR